MSTIFADRIASRLEALGKNPSGVALEAGLGRSSVRDILVGKVASPRMDTLYKLTGPLECSLEYLTGLQDAVEPPEHKERDTSPGWYDPIEIVAPTRLEIGVFRTDEADNLRMPTAAYNPPDRAYSIDKRHLYYNDLRLPEHFFTLYELADTSLTELNILPGDTLTAAAPHHGAVPLKRGTIVVIRRRLSNGAEELSARFVDLVDGSIVLTSRSTEPKYKPIPIVDRPESEDLYDSMGELFQNTHHTEDGQVEVEGLVVRVTRKMPI